MRRQIALRTLLAFSALGLIACDKTPTEEQVATINGEPITVKEYQNILGAQFGTTVARNSTERKWAIDYLIKRKLLIQEAQHQQLDKNNKVALAIKLNREQLLIRALTSKYLQDNPVTEQDAKRRYEELKKETEYKVSHVLLPQESQAIQFIADIKKGKSFRRIAMKHSLDLDSARRGGSIGWLNRYGIAPHIYFAAAKLKKGEVSATPVKSDYGWHIVRRDASRNTKLPPFNKHKMEMLERVQRERIDTLIDHLRSRATIVVSTK